MNDFKISIITVVYNAENTIGKCIDSVINQKYNNIEYIVIDGGSTDKTVEVINRYQKFIALFVSEKDKGIYDAMNKGIKLATGNVIGMLNADDCLAYPEVVADIASAFQSGDTDILYGNLNFINLQGKIVRKWKAGQYKSNLFNTGWMPPHPTLYCKRGLFDKYGLYSLDFGSAADYELMLRFMYINKPNVYYLNKTMVEMLIGGVSNKSLTNRVKVLEFDLKAMQKNKIFFPLVTIFLKPLRKVLQFI